MNKRHPLGAVAPASAALSLGPRVVLIGGGFSGTLTAIRILDLVESGIDVVLIEKSAGNDYGGLAFGEVSCGWEHLLNIQAGRVSLFREEPDDFLNWANGHETSKTDWPARWRNFEFNPSSPVPRRVYGLYLRDRLALITARRPGSRVRLIRDTAVNLAAAPESVVVTLAGSAGSRHTIKADFAILATGHWEAQVPAELRGVADPAGLIVTDPYSAAGREALLRTSPNARVTIVGTGLTSFDIILTLLSIGHEGPVTCVSRHGFEHRPYPRDHLHDIPPPHGLIDFAMMHSASPDEFLSTFLRDFARVRRRFSDLPQTVRDERTWKVLEPIIAKFCQAAAPGLVKELLRMFKSAMVTSRIGTVEEIVAPIFEQRKAGRLSTLTGEIRSVVADQAAVTLDIARPDGRRHVQTADRVVLATGRITDLAMVGDQLWGNLCRSGYARPEPVTGFGVAADEKGRLRGLVRTNRIFAVGPMRQGDELVRNGRTGAFVFSIGTLRNQAHQTALNVAQLIRRSRMGLTLDDEPGLADIGEAAYDHAAMLRAAIDGITTNSEVMNAFRHQVGYPISRRPGGPDSWNAQRAQHELAERGAAEALRPRLALVLLEYLEAEAVRSLTDISRLAPEIAERVALQRQIRNLCQLEEMKGSSDMAPITVELSRAGGTATRAQIRGHEIVVDRPKAGGGGDTGPMGGELLLAAIGGCFMSTFIATVNAQSITVDDAVCSVTGNFSADSPRRFSQIEMAVSSSSCPGTVLADLVADAEQNCIVMNTLRGSLELSVTAK